MRLWIYSKVTTLRSRCLLRATASADSTDVPPPGRSCHLRSPGTTDDKRTKVNPHVQPRGRDGLVATKRRRNRSPMSPAGWTINASCPIYRTGRLCVSADVCEALIVWAQSMTFILFISASEWPSPHPSAGSPGCICEVTRVKRGRPRRRGGFLPTRQFGHCGTR